MRVSLSASSRHSPIARNASTATMLIPDAPMNDPVNIPIPVGTAHDPEHCTSTMRYPIAAPAIPETRMPENAIARARMDGNAERGRSEPGVVDTTTA